MSLILSAVVGVAFAGGSVVQMDDRPATLPPTLTDDGAWTLRSRGELFPTTAWAEVDDRALQELATELEAVLPLIHELDGEMAIMERLQVAIDGVTALRDEADRELLYAALACQGYAVQRYFQSELDTDPMASDWRVALGGTKVRPWVDAVALMPSMVPTAEHIAEAPERERFQALREAIIALPPARIRAALPPGASLVVDGAPAANGVEVPPGRHIVGIQLGGQLVHREALELAPGASITVTPGVDPNALAALTTRMHTGEGLILLEPEIQQALSALPAPVHLTVGSADEAMLYQIQGAAAERLVEASAATSSSPWSLHGGLGLGWLNDRDWYLENAANGAPDESATVNSALPSLSLRATHEGPLTYGAGLDVLVPLGQWHRLPTGEGSTRGRFYPHLSAGLPWLQATAGYLSPSQIGLGLRPQLPLSGGFEISLQTLYGVGLTRYRVDQPDVTASPIYASWLSLVWGGNL